MQGVIWQEQNRPLFFTQLAHDQIEIDLVVASIKLVPHDRMPEMCQVDSNLMFSPAQRPDCEQRKIPSVATEYLSHVELGSSHRAVGPHPVLNRHPALLILAEWRINDSMRSGDTSMHDCQVLLHDSAAFPQ